MQAKLLFSCCLSPSYPITSAVVSWCFGQGMDLISTMSIWKTTKEKNEEKDGFKWCLQCASLCRRIQVPQVLFSALWGSEWGRLFPGRVLFHFTFLERCQSTKSKMFWKEIQFYGISELKTFLSK